MTDTGCYWLSESGFYALTPDGLKLITPGTELVTAATEQATAWAKEWCEKESNQKDRAK